jgi:hypothetical protein
MVSSPRAPELHISLVLSAVNEYEYRLGPAISILESGLLAEEQAIVALNGSFK